MTDPDTAMRMIRKVQRDLLAASEVKSENLPPTRLQTVRVDDLKMKIAMLMGAMRHPV